MPYKDKEKQRQYWSEYSRSHRERRNSNQRKLWASDPERMRQYGRRWAKANPDRIKAIHQRFQRKARETAIALYGGCCVCCGETRILFLELDHINNDGKEHRSIGHNIIHWLAKNPGQTEFEIQVLCANCHRAKTSLGHCPYHGETFQESLVGGDK